MMTETEALRQNYELGVLAGEAREQARIIKLLNKYDGQTLYPGFVLHEHSSDKESCDCYFQAPWHDLLALIKGENK